MDITHRFKAGVMSAKMDRKGQQPLDKSRILPKAGPMSPRDEFSRQAKDACSNITSLRNLLLENRTSYMRIGQHLKTATPMTDQERDLIDRESQKFVSHYAQHLAQMRSDWKRTKRKPQQHEHIDAVLDMLGNYLRKVQQIHLEQKRYRMQHELETHSLLKLAADRNKIPIRSAIARGNTNDKSKSTKHISWKASAEFSEHTISNISIASSDKTDFDSSSLFSTDDDDDDDDDDEESSSSSAEVIQTYSESSMSSNATVTKAEQMKNSLKVATDEYIQKSQLEVNEEETEAGSDSKPEDIQMFEQENVQLYQELLGLTEEVEQIERNVVDIAQLQEIFTEKVSLQQHNIERIANAVIGSTENVRDANEQIKQAIQRNAGLRVWSLFFLIVMSFALLFLDWYYD